MSKRIPIITITAFLVIQISCFKVYCFSIQKEDSTNYITFSKIDAAWKYSKGANTIVAVVDWLFDLSPEAAKKYIMPTSMIPGEEVGTNEPWHGEWMATIVHTIAPDAKIIPIRGNPGNNGSYESYLIKAIRFAADNGAAAVTNSMGPVKHTKELLDAIDYAWEKGTIFIDVHPEYISNDSEGYKFCKTGECSAKIIHTGIVSVPKYTCEPEEIRDIYTWPYEINPKFKDGWGYSNAPPIVAGVIALIKSANPKLKPKEIKDIIITTADNRNGFKVLNAEAAIKKAMKNK